MKGSLGRSRYRWESNVKINLKQIGYGDVASFFLIRTLGEGVESDWVHSARRPPTGLLYLPRVIMRMNLVEWWLAGETEEVGENLLQYHFVHHKYHMTWKGANQGRRSGKPATNRLRYGTALAWVCLAQDGVQWRFFVLFLDLLREHYVLRKHWASWRFPSLVKRKGKAIPVTGRGGP
jgi:hypothetical protein